jgi:hypothetical protein
MDQGVQLPDLTCGFTVSPSECRDGIFKHDITAYAMKTDRGVEVLLHAFLTSTLDVVERSS